MSRRLYLGRLPPDSRTEDVHKYFDGFGRIVDCRVMTGFGFVEFESSRDAEEALQQFADKQFLGQSIVIEFAKENRPRREPPEHERPRSNRRPPGFRVIVSGISRDTSWQDLKDFGREGGNVTFADIDRDNAGQGILEYISREDADRAVKDLDGRDLRGRPVRVNLGESRGGADNYRRDDRDRYRDDRRDDRHRDDRHRDDRPRDDRHRDDRRRERSRSPGRFDDRRRSPPRRDYDDRRSYSRRDDERREERDRPEERARPSADAEWTR